MTADRTVPCPRPYGAGTAIFIDDGHLEQVGGILWSCEYGHHGPRLVQP